MKQDPVAEGGWSRRLTVPESHPAFDGHFPGQPILPGIVQIGLVLEGLRETLGDGVHIVAIPSVRWRALIRPGELLDLKVTGPSADGRLTFEIRRRGELVTNGAMLVGGEFPQGGRQVVEQ